MFRYIECQAAISEVFFLSFFGYEFKMQLTICSQLKVFRSIDSNSVKGFPKDSKYAASMVRCLAFNFFALT